MVNDNDILDLVYDFFLKSYDFNGITISGLSEETKTDYIVVLEIISRLVVDNKVSVQNGINPHIISLCHFNTETQLKIIEEAKGNKFETYDWLSNSIPITKESFKVCVYPSMDYLRKNRNITSLSHQPYTCQLAIGEPQLKPVFFQIDVLDRYYNDPRYKFKLEDYSGNIFYEDENNLTEKDKIFINSFGFGYDKNKNRFAVVYLCYLNNLNAEHQLYWKSKQVNNSDCNVLKEYYINTIEGKPTNCCSIYNVVLDEQRAINKLCDSAFNKPFFREEFSRYDKPQEFNTILFPTLKNYYDFILTAEKLFVDNINKEFFHKQIDLTKNERRKDGTIKTIDKGTIALFEEWMKLNHSIASELIFNERFFKPFKKIRKERQKPAHKILKNDFKKEYTELQNQIMSELYDSLHIFRQILQSHPKNKDVQVDNWVDNCQVKIY